MKNEIIYNEKNGMSIKGWVLTIASGVYVISPIDAIPDFVVGFGWIDDLLAAITGLTTVVNSQLTQANLTFSSMLKFIRLISFSLWAILVMLVLLLGTTIFQIFN
jgi:uncharacterized membrane protein YkvA (DUF1232 family)